MSQVEIVIKHLFQKNVGSIKKIVKGTFFLWLFMVVPYLIPAGIFYYIFVRIIKKISEKRKVSVPMRVAELIHWTRIAGWTDKEIIREMDQKAQKYPRSSISIWYMSNNKEFKKALKSGFVVW
ncbi:hypothetical protein FH950_002183 [Enterococcus faecium]|nr:hypothetical protein [Enterococcus faecium]